MPMRYLLTYHTRKRFEERKEKENGGLNNQAFVNTLTSQRKEESQRKVSICNRMRPSRIEDKFSCVFSKFSQNCPSRVATRAICENFENTSENLTLNLRGVNAITCL